METKICTKCKIEKPIEEFNRNKTSKDGRHCWCNSCKSEYNIIYNKRAETKRSKAEYAKEYNQRPEIITRSREYQKEHNKYQREYQREYHQRPEAKERRAQRSINNKDVITSKTLLRKYGITLEQKQQMIENQGGRCAICNKVLDNGRHTCVDHDHKTGKVRGILCRKCNFLIGHSKDNPIILSRAINYLDRHKEEHDDNNRSGE